MEASWSLHGGFIEAPFGSVRDIPTIPAELFAKFQTSFYAGPTEAGGTVKVFVFGMSLFPVKERFSR